MDTIIFRKPKEDGDVADEKDASFSLAHVTRMRAVIDRNKPSSQQCRLLFLCPGGQVYQYGPQNTSTTSPVEKLELCFAKEQHFHRFLVALTPTKPEESATTYNIPVEELKIIELGAIHGDPELPKDIYVRSPFTGKFASREVVLIEGTLRWIRPGRKDNSRAQSLHLADSLCCDLTFVEARSVPKFGYQLTLETAYETVTLGMTDITMLLKWIEALRELVQHSGISHEASGGLLVESVLSEDPEVIERSLQAVAPLSELEGEDKLFEGHLYKRKEAGRSIDYKGFQKRWFVLTRSKLEYYKSKVHAGYDGEEPTPPMGALSLSYVLEARECSDVSAPVNCLEIVTSDKSVFILIAENAEEHDSWIEAICDALEAFEVSCVPVEEEEPESAEEIAKREAEMEERREAICKSIAYSGMLKFKKVGKLSFATRWVDRFVVIASGNF
jgi:hypothetical protein